MNLDKYDWLPVTDIRSKRISKARREIKEIIIICWANEYDNAKYERVMNLAPKITTQYGDLGILAFCIVINVR